MKTLRPGARLAVLNTSKVRALEPAKATNRIRGRKLQSIRSAQYRRQPFCVRCLELGISRVFDVIDHTIPLALGGLDEASNRRPLCTPCHLVVTEEQFGRARAGSRGGEG